MREDMLKLHYRDLQKRVPLLRKVELVQNQDPSVQICEGYRYLLRSEIGVEFTVPRTGYSQYDQERTFSECLSRAQDLVLHKVYGSLLDDIHEIAMLAHDDPRSILDVCDRMKAKIIGPKR